MILPKVAADSPRKLAYQAAPPVGLPDFLLDIVHILAPRRDPAIHRLDLSTDERTLVFTGATAQLAQERLLGFVRANDGPITI